MSRSSVFARTLADRLRATGLFAAGVVAVAAVYVSMYPPMADEIAVYAESVPEVLAVLMGEIADPAGYLHATIFALLGVVLLVAAAATFGAAAIAGEEEAATLPLLFTVPISRLTVAVHKLAGLAVAVTVLALVLFAAVTALVVGLGIDVPAANIAAGTLHLHAFALFALGLAFGIGAATGRRAPSLAVTLGVVVAGYVLHGVAHLLDGFEALRWVSPFYWSAGTEPVVNGPAWGWLALLYTAAAVAAAAGIWRFTRRDLA